MGDLLDWKYKLLDILIRNYSQAAKIKWDRMASLGAQLTWQSWYMQWHVLSLLARWGIDGRALDEATGETTATKRRSFLKMHISPRGKIHSAVQSWVRDTSSLCNWDALESNCERQTDCWPFRNKHERLKRCKRGISIFTIESCAFVLNYLVIVVNKQTPTC